MDGWIVTETVYGLHASWTVKDWSKFQCGRLCICLIRCGRLGIGRNHLTLRRAGSYSFKGPADYSVARARFDISNTIYDRSR